MSEQTASEGDQISVEVVYGETNRQVLKSLSVAPDCTVADAIERSGIASEFVDFELHPGQVGIFGRVVSLSRVLKDGDRVEIYRPLKVDPKELRRQRAAEQQ